MKTCFKCNELKPLSEYYKHQQMGDGHLNKCKECTKRDSNDRHLLKLQDPEWVQKERDRHKIKARRYYGLPDDYIREKLPKEEYEYRRKVNGIFSNAVRDRKIKRKPCQVCKANKAQGHHEDYSKPFDVVWLCPRHHADRHIHLRDRKTLGIEPMPINEFIAQLAQKTSSPIA